jgi:amino acid adenylation domain-containing protein
MTDLDVENQVAAAAEPLYAGFLRSALRAPDHPAVEVDGATLSYRDLELRARSIAATLERYTPPGGSPIAAVFSYRTPSAFAGVLGALLSGLGYVALNRRFPPLRNRVMLETADARALIVDRESSNQLAEMLEGFPHSLLLLLPDIDDVRDIAGDFPTHTVLGRSDMRSADEWTEPPFDPAAIAYLIFTSGSTGTPKAVMVPHQSIRRYVELMTRRWQPTELDRVSQTFDMTFDLSVTDMFVAWEGGATLCCPSAQQIVKPGKFIIESRINVWYAVPSVGLLMKRLGMLGAGRYPGVRLVLFCGEALPIELARAWSEAAPNAIVENVYGPTEVTITCAAYTWDSERSPSESEHGVVPIGYMYEGMEAVVLDEAGLEVRPGEEGELYLRGPQVTPGYWRNPEQTASAFFVPRGREGMPYRTGDRVRRPQGSGPLVYLGRLDHQVKVSGHRVELGEIEAVLREESGVDEVVVLGWPPIDTGFAAVIAFVRGDDLDHEPLLARMSARLPEYMVPREIRVLDEIPLNLNHKFDRNALRKILENER